VVVGRDLGKTIELASGLPAGTRFVTNPNDTLRDGTTVTAAPDVAAKKVCRSFKSKPQIHMSTTSQKLAGKVSIVTGASKGIGAAIATHLAAAGASVVVNYSSSKEGADRVVAEITSKGGKAVAVQAD